MEDNREMLNIDEIENFIDEYLQSHYSEMVRIINTISIDELFVGNPYFLYFQNIHKVSELVESTLDAFLSSSEEKLFGDFLEGLAIFIAGKTTGGHKSSCEGMDLEFIKDGIYHVVSIKSGPNWGNAAQHAHLSTDFSNAEKRLRQSNHVTIVQKILGICYGKTKTSSSHGYIKLVGQNFWTYISNNENLYIDIIEPVGYHAREHNQVYQDERSRITNLLTKTFIEKYCSVNGNIDWTKLLQANSGNYDLDTFFGE